MPIIMPPVRPISPFNIALVTALATLCPILLNLIMHHWRHQ